MAALRAELESLVSDPEGQQEAIQLYFQREHSVSMHADQESQRVRELEDELALLHCQLAKEQHEQHDVMEKSCEACCEGTVDTYSDIIHLIEQELNAEKTRRQQVEAMLESTRMASAEQANEISRYRELFEGVTGNLRSIEQFEVEEQSQIDALLNRIEKAENLLETYRNAQEIGTSTIVNSPKFSSRKSPLVLMATPIAAAGRNSSTSVDLRPVEQNNFIFVNNEDLRDNFEIYRQNIPRSETIRSDLVEIVQFVSNLESERKDDFSELLNTDTTQFKGQLDTESEEKIFSFLQCLMQERGIGGEIGQIELDGTSAAHMLACDLFIAFMMGYIAVFREGQLMPDLELEGGTDVIPGW